MNKDINLFIFFVVAILVLSSCSNYDYSTNKQVTIEMSTPKPKNTKTPGLTQKMEGVKTPTIATSTPYTVETSANTMLNTWELMPTMPAPWELIVFSILNENNSITEGPLPYEENGNWNIEISGYKIVILVTEKGTTFNRVRLSVVGEKEYEILVSKGAILFLRVFYNRGDAYAFSPDIGDKGNFVECDSNNACFWPASLVQIDINLKHNIFVQKRVVESDGWCRKLENLPMPIPLLQEMLVYYTLPTRVTIVDWSHECPKCEITEIT